MVQVQFSLEQEIHQLKHEIRNLGNQVQLAIARVIEALVRRDPMLAGLVISTDAHVDRQEVQIEEHCVRVLADHHPEGDPLRFVVAVLKANNDLERIGDLAVNIAKTVRALWPENHYSRTRGFSDMARKVEEMVDDALDALLEGNVEEARRVIRADRQIDRLRDQMIRQIAVEMDRKPENAEALMAVSYMVRQFERIGDMATNIAEDAIYMVEGKIVRHAGLPVEG